MVINHEEVEKQAKQILDKFADALKVVDKVDLDSYVDRDEFERIEVGISSENKSSEKSINADKSVNDFKQKILENAPEHDEDFILVERGSWK